MHSTKITALDLLVTVMVENSFKKINIHKYLVSPSSFVLWYSGTSLILSLVTLCKVDEIFLH